ncbi:dephospho-CoA kinase [Parvibium lacunae]|uniref:Dephospho-CoA kinase n=1 Tax=Parvibium lacunae TaxID=1888893 RepID=A0A368L2C6_9BURK|nr:dephospho-CoA kinase [Parvibium lacunae]RCS57540.1 dephospho-CoA kinase [Parvibium lacunae]
MNTPLRIGMTGGIGSGKSAAAHYFAHLGATIIDSDQIAHQLTTSGGLAIPAIRQHFGTDYLTTNGSLDRQRMRERIFQDHVAKRTLEAILHPLIRAACWQQAQESAAAPYQIWVIPLLYEHPDWQENLDRILVIDCDEETQIHRVMQRSQLTREAVEQILRQQAKRIDRLSIANDVIVNIGDFAALQQQVDALHQLYLNRTPQNHHRL